jgi:nuclear GTP-binding protein
MPKIRKSISKRVSLRKKFSVATKVKDHKKKLKKEVRKMKAGGVSGKAPKKVPGIPNLYPFKSDMLDAIERKEALDVEIRENAKSLRHASKALPGGTITSYAE